MYGIPFEAHAQRVPGERFRLHGVRLPAVGELEGFDGLRRVQKVEVAKPGICVFDGPDEALFALDAVPRGADVAIRVVLRSLIDERVIDVVEKTLHQHALHFDFGERCVREGRGLVRE